MGYVAGGNANDATCYVPHHQAAVLVDCDRRTDEVRLVASKADRNLAPDGAARLPVQRADEVPMPVEPVQHQQRAHQQLVPLDRSAGYGVETGRRRCPGALERLRRPGHIDPGADDQSSVRGCFGQDPGDLPLASRPVGGSALGGRAVANNEIVRPLELDRDVGHITCSFDQGQ